MAYIGDEARRMKGLVDDMLFLAKADAAREPLPRPAAEPQRRGLELSAAL